MFLDVLSLKNKEIAVIGTRKSGDFVAVDVVQRDGTGARYILRQSGDVFMIIDGPRQDIPLCAQMDKLSIPQELYVSCYDSNGNVRQ